MPDILADRAVPPAWREWTDILLEAIASADEFILVGHSSASALVADLSTRLPARGLIIVDGDIPPADGPASPVRPTLREFIETLARPGGTLPVWSEWFAGDHARAALVGIDQLARDQAAFAQFESRLPTMRNEWFDDVIELRDWSHVPAGFIQTSTIFDHATVEAVCRGWPALNTYGTHLDPMLRPKETASAILQMASLLKVPD